MQGYDPVADAYAERYYRELDSKPFDRERLDAFAALLPGGGRVLDLGCGPGHVGRYLLDKGLNVTGFDLSEGMLKQARHLNPGITFIRGDLLNLRLEPNAWSGMVAAYSLIHVPQGRLIGVLSELRQALKPGGPLLASFHLGSGAFHSESMFNTRVSLDFYLYSTPDVRQAFQQAGFTGIETWERDPYPEVEYQGRRVYVMGANPKAS